MSYEVNPTVDEMAGGFDVPVERVLEHAAGHDLKRVVVIGVKQDGSPYWATSSGHLEIIETDIEEFLEGALGVIGLLYPDAPVTEDK